MKETFIKLYEEYFETINDIFTKLSLTEWILISLIFIGLLTKIPFLILIPLSYSSYLALENETVNEALKETFTLSPEFQVLGFWVICIFIRAFILKRKDDTTENPKIIKSLVSFSLVLVLTFAIGTPTFENESLKELKYVIMLGILLYALFHIFIHSIGLIKNVVITFAWIFVITILGIQQNPEYFKNIVNEKDVKKFVKLKENIQKMDVKNIVKVKDYLTDIKL